MSLSVLAYVRLNVPKGAAEGLSGGNSAANLKAMPPRGVESRRRCQVFHPSCDERLHRPFGSGTCTQDGAVNTAKTDEHGRTRHLWTVSVRDMAEGRSGGT